MDSVGTGARTVENITSKGEHKPINGAGKNERKSQVNLKGHTKMSQPTKSPGIHMVAQFHFILISHL